MEKENDPVEEGTSANQVFEDIQKSIKNLESIMDDLKSQLKDLEKQVAE